MELILRRFLRLTWCLTCDAEKEACNCAIPEQRPGSHHNPVLRSVCLKGQSHMLLAETAVSDTLAPLVGEKAK